MGCNYCKESHSDCECSAEELDAHDHGLEMGIAIQRAEVEALRNKLETLTTAIRAQVPVMWQSRARQTMDGYSGPWSDWREGKSSYADSPYFEVEERALYLAIPEDLL